jgi:hypothetical protein
MKSSALSDLALLRDVVEFKERFYYSSWARYDLARPGTFRLAPPKAKPPRLRETTGRCVKCSSGNRQNSKSLWAGWLPWNRKSTI